MSNSLSAKFTLRCSRLLACLMPVLAVCLPWILRFYTVRRPLGQDSRLAILVGFYCCLPVVLYALLCIDRLLKNILAEKVFVEENVRFIRRIRWCCAAVSGICLPAALFYPPLIFLSVIMAFLSLMVSVVKNVIAAAVELREENDLTI